MKVKNLAICGIAAAFALAAATAVRMAAADRDAPQAAVGGGTNAQKAAAKASPEKRREARKVRKAKRLPRRTEVAPEREKPTINIDDPEFSSLEAHHREMLKELQSALDEANFELARSIVERLIELGKRDAAANGSTDWSKFVPVAMRRKAVETLGWFGAKALPEISAFLPDADPSVRADAQLQLEQALQDFELSDYELSDIVTSLMQITDDPDVLDSYYMELSRMRNSVMISTLVEIGQSGSEAAKEKLPENISFYTGDFEIETIEQAEQWLEDNPDGEDDDEFYGGIKMDE